MSKNSNTIQNQKILAQQIQMNNLLQQSDIDQNQAEGQYIQQPHHVKSKSFMHNDFVSVTEDATKKPPNSYKQTKTKGSNLLANEPQFLMNNMIINQHQNKQKTSKQTLEAKQINSKKNSNQTSVKTKASLEKTGQSANTKLGIKQQSFQNKPNRKLQHNNYVNNTIQQTNTMGIPTPEIISAKISSQLQTSGVTGTQSNITSSQAKLEKSINQPQQIMIISKNMQAGHHQRNNSDANYIANLQNNNKQNFVISTSNHYKQSKKASNLKSMSSNSNNQVSSQGATKGLLNKLQESNNAANRVGKVPGHKKNQYSTIVKSNYQNLVDAEEVYGEIDQDYRNEISKQIDLDIFNSNQNKTTEQKYAELKMKYNDLLNKHLYLAAQKTEDNRKLQKMKQSQQMKVIAQGGVQKLKQMPFHPSNMLENVQLQQIPNVQNNTIQNSQIVHSEQLYGDTMQHHMNRHSDLTENQFDNGAITINDQEEMRQTIHDEEDQFNSQSYSQGQTPREIRATYDYHQKMIKNPLQRENKSPQDFENNQSTSQKISSNNLNQYQMKIQQSIENQNSRTEAHAHINVAKNFTDGQNKLNLLTKQKPQHSYNGNYHKRSVSDGIFNNIISKKKYGQFHQGYSIDNEPKASIHTYNQQIPLKQNNRQMGDFDHKIKNMRISNDVHVSGQQQLAQHSNMEILGDNEHIIEEVEQIESTNNYSQQEENLVTDQGQEHEFGEEAVGVYDDFTNQNSDNRMQYNNKNQQVQLKNQFAMIIEENSPDINKEPEATVQTQQSEMLHVNFKNEVKIKKKKPTGKSIDKNEEENKNTIPDIDMNKLAQKYKQMRKSGEYTAGLSSDASNGRRPVIMNKIMDHNETTKASGQISDRFGPVDVMQNRNLPLLEGVGKNVHRRVKSGVPEHAVNQNALKIQVYQQRGKNESQNTTGQQAASNVPSSGQRSLKSLKENQKQISQKSKQVNKPHQDKGPNSNFMLIYEEQPSEEQFFNKNFPNKNMSLFQGHNGSHESLNKKVINVSFNDMNPSISYECDDINQEENYHNKEVVVTENTARKQIAQNMSSNKNLNNFLEALSKIKPQSAMVTQNSPKNQSGLKDRNSPKIMNSHGGQKIKKPNKSEIPAGFSDQNRLQKYQKMMQKVKANDKNKPNEPNVKVRPGHQKNKSTNDGLVGSNLFGVKKMQEPQKYVKGTAGQYTPQGIDFNYNKGNEKIIEDQNDSQKNLKITFIGDEALLKQHQKMKNLPNKGNQKANLYQQKNKKVSHLQNQAFIQSASGSNTGGQPSPIISTKRVPQKILAQHGDSSLSPPAGVSYKKGNNVMKNNYVKQSIESDPKKIQKKKIKVLNKNSHHMVESEEESIDFNPHDGSSGARHKLIQNLNKGNGNYVLQQSPMQNLGTPISQSEISHNEQIHIIKHPVTAKTNQKISDFNMIGEIVSSSFHNTNTQAFPPQAPQVSERLNTEESSRPSGVNGDLTPRTKQIRKLIKQIRLSFKLQNIGPQTTIDFYRIGKILGKGAFGKVNLAVHKLTECLCAVKSINKQYFSDPSQSKKVMQEVVMLKKTRHQNIVRLYEYFETDKYILFVIELCAGGDLLNYVRRRRRLKEDIAKCLFKQIIESLAYCHKKNILHRDIKLDNILLDANGQVKICDFGVGKIVKKGEKMTEQCGTPAYIAPEILRDEGYYGYAVDIWSSGVVLYAMLYGTVPFKANNMSELQKLIMKAKYTLKDDVSQDARDLLKGLMEKDPLKRMTISNILQHPWLKDAKDSHNVELFTEQEKQYIKAEFSYNKSKRYNRNFDNHGLNGPNIVSDPLGDQSSCADLDKDMFTEHQLDSIQNSILKNCETKSVILAPFNSTKSNLQFDENGNCPNYELSDSIKELIEDRKIIKFGARVRDIDRQYEINNNADLDNGVYHKFDEEEENKEEIENKSSESSEEKEEQQIQNVEQLDEEEQEILKQLKKQGKQKIKAATNKKNKQTELQKLEDMIQDQEEEDKIIIQAEDDGGGNLVTENSQQPSVLIDQADSLEQHFMSPAQGNPDDLKLPQGGQTTEESIYSPIYSNDLYLRDLYQQQLLAENIVLEETIISQVEQFGYPRDYILKGLNNHDLNYATTAYLLLHFQKKLIETQNIINQMKIIENSNNDAEPKEIVRNASNSGRQSASILEGKSQSKSIPDMN